MSHGTARSACDASCTVAIRVRGHTLRPTLVPPTLVPMVVTPRYRFYERDNLAGVQRANASLSDRLTFVRAQSSAKHRDNAAQHAIDSRPTLIFLKPL